MQALALKRTSSFTRVAVAGAFVLALILLASPAAYADEDTTTGKRVSQLGGKLGDLITNTGATVGKTVGGNVGKQVTKTTSTAGSTVSSTSSTVGGAVDKTVSTVQRVVNNGAEGVGKVINDTTQSGGAGSKKKNQTENNKRDGVVDDAVAPSLLFRVPDRLAGLPAQAVSAEIAAAPASAPTETALGQFVRRMVETAKRFAFPVALTLLVLAYLAIQGWFDRRDPKLALATVDPDADLLRFE